MSKSINEIANEFWFGVGSIKDLEDWAEFELRKDAPHPDACILFGLRQEDAHKWALELAMKINGHSPISEEGEIFAKNLLIKFSNDLLESKITPSRFCSLVTQIDADFLGHRPETPGVIYYPTWLADLWNHCDWCDDTWTNENSPELIQRVREYLKQVT